ncbi:MAG: cupredoxin domain-containing protein [Nitrososphaerales archaeon]
MNRISASIGTVLVLIAAFLFLITFSGGNLGPFTVTGSNPNASFLAFLFVIIFLPVGAGLAFFGYAYRRPILATGAPMTVTRGSSGLAKAAVALAIIAIILALGAFVTFFTVPSGTSGTQFNSLSAKVNGIASVNATPSVVPLKVDWCNTDNTGQDRFCPSQIVVAQGDTVVIWFVHNDTDAHTFTIIPSGTNGYSFQINATAGIPGETNINGTLYANGMHDFLNNANYTGSCSNSGTFAQDSAGISGTYCVSGTSLIAPGTNYGFVNPVPSSPLNGSANDLVQVTATNTVTFPMGDNMSGAYAGLIPAEAQGIGAFKATQPGIYEFFCHYHVSNGMFGYIIVLPNSACNATPDPCS